MNYRVGIYTRLSRDDEREGESMSIENQKVILGNYVREQGWELIETYVDDGYTGTNFDRPDFQRMVEDVKDRKINLVVVKDLSRFGRNYIQVGEYTDYLFPSVGCRFIALNDGVDTLNTDNDIMPFKNLFNEFYSRDISKKVRSAKMARAKGGNYLCAYAPYGYRHDPQNHAHLIVDETVAPVVRRMFDMRMRGLSYLLIAKALNEEKVLSPRDYYYKCLGKENPRRVTHTWSDITVKEFLSNEAYIGNTVQFKTGSISYKNHKRVDKPQENWIRCEGTHEAVVDRETWDTVQEINRKKSRFRSQKEGTVTLFSGLLQCADCRGSMKMARDYNTRKDGHMNNRHAYICCTYSRGGIHACAPHRIMMHVLTDLVKEDIQKHARRILLDEDTVVRELIRRKNADSTSERATAERKLQVLRERVSQLDKLIAKAYEEMVAGDIPREVLLGLVDRYQSERNEKNGLAGELAERLAKSEETEQDIHRWVELIKRYMNVEEIDRDLLLRLIDKIIVGQKIEMEGVLQQSIIIVYNFVGALD
ncbi:hypothetical protein CAFE_03180 [Caprobacter fermentans]|uniref:Recombinase n=1 Tax=Caproicibacter fermentans TaxID=2576756 RepID=A0A6N8HV53_9FIRM|nr:recombinase family protein [Caproicibacter fermentans]MVB09656.1 hypothetical protein [Caproicibacter fermentans]